MTNKTVTTSLITLAVLATIGTSLYIVGKTGDTSVKTVLQPSVEIADKTLPTQGIKKIKPLKINGDHTVLVFDEIGSNAASIANKISALSNSSEPTIVLINSPGGSVLDGALVNSAIEASKTPVYTVCLQLCASMAAHIHKSGSKRFMVDRSILMFHPASGGVQGTTYQMEARLSTLKRYVDKMNATAAFKAGLPLDKFLQMQSGELWIDAEDSVNQKFADGLVSLDLSDIDQKGFSAQQRQSIKIINEHFDMTLKDF